MEKEIIDLSHYKVVNGYPNYFVDCNGNVYSLNRHRHLKWYLIKGSNRPHVTFCSNGVYKKFFIANLVATYFVTNPKPNVYKYVRYKDGNSANNNYKNLEWCRNQTGSKYEPI